MATIIVPTTTTKAAKKVLAKVYEADRAASYTSDKKAVSGSVLTAQIKEGNNVEIHSGYYVESSLKQMFE